MTSYNAVATINSEVLCQECERLVECVRAVDGKTTLEPCGHAATLLVRVK